MHAFPELECYVTRKCFVVFADPLADSSRPEDIDDSTDYVHVRIQQRNGKKSLTTIQVSFSMHLSVQLGRSCLQPQLQQLHLHVCHTYFNRA